MQLLNANRRLINLNAREKPHPTLFFVWDCYYNMDYDEDLIRLTLDDMDLDELYPVSD